MDKYHFSDDGFHYYAPRDRIRIYVDTLIQGVLHTAASAPIYGLLSSENTSIVDASPS